MAGNDRGKAMMPLLGDRGESAQPKFADPWDEVKSDAIRLYRDEGKDLEPIRTEIEEIYGFTRCPRMWRAKFTEWDCRKNIEGEDMQWIVAKGKERMQEGKDTDFVHYGIPVKTQRIETFKKRKKKGDPPVSMATPPNITYRTPPGPESQSGGFESPPPASFESPPADFEVVSASFGSLFAGFESAPGGLECQPAGFESPPAGFESQPAAFESLSFGFEGPLAGFESPPADSESLPTGFESQPTGFESLLTSLESLPAGFESKQHFIEEMYEEPVEYNAPLSQVPSVSIAQASSVRPPSPKIKHLPATMLVMERFVLDENQLWSVLNMSDQKGKYNGALTRQQGRAAQVLGSTFVPKEQINSSPQSPNDTGDQVSLNLYSDMCWEKEDKEHFEALVYDKSFVLVGLALTLDTYQERQKCSALDVASSAKHMYQVLLEHSMRVDPIRFGSKEVIDHLSYGTLLKTKGEWTLRVEQLLVACESAMKLETYSSQLIEPLQRDFIDLLLGIEPDEKTSSSLCSDSLSRFESRFERPPQINDPESMQISTFDRHQDSPHLESTWSSERHSTFTEYMLSNYRSCNTSAKSNQCLAQFELFSGTSNPTERNGDSSSTGSLPDSHKYGLTYSVSDIAGISDSIFMTP
ncbi:hypothetical protein O988_03112 [Pseudogymnoascus sp. VKM F-3808]|nr:hypothetical protein O988_03112 [Pseudogymnoascus sp. VKM F-3808]